ncbi:unnamed protein product, partial [Trichobilharzia regenti]
EIKTCQLLPFFFFDFVNTFPSFLYVLLFTIQDVKFLDLLYENEHFEKLIDWLTVISLTALTKSDDSLLETHSNPPSVNQLLFDGGELTNRSCNPDNSRPESSIPEVVNSGGGGGGVPTAHPEYPVHLLVANFLANISQHSFSYRLINHETPAAPSTTTSTPAAASHCKSGEEYSQTKDYDSLKSFPIYCPDIYKLNISK